MLPISASSECQTASLLILSRPRNSSHLVVDRWTTLDGTPPSLHAYYRRFITTTGRSALLARTRYSAARGLAACRPPGGSRANPRKPLSRRGVLLFHCRAQAKLAPPSCRAPPEQ